MGAYGFNEDKSRHEIYQIRKKTVSLPYSAAKTWGAISEALFNAVKDIHQNVVKIVEKKGSGYEDSVFTISKVYKNSSLQPTRIFLSRLYSVNDDMGGFTQEMMILRQNTSSEIWIRKTIDMVPTQWNQSYATVNFHTNTMTVNNKTDTVSGVKTYDIYYFDDVKEET